MNGHVSRAAYDAVIEERDILVERVAELEGALTESSGVLAVLGLSKTASRFLRHLVARPLVTRDSALIALYDDLSKDRPEAKILDVYVCRMRAKLKPHGIRIVTHWGRGWSISTEDKAKLRALPEWHSPPLDPAGKALWDAHPEGPPPDVREREV